MTVDELDEKERNLLLRISNIKGLAEQQTSRLETEEIFNSYKQVHFYYADLAEENNEALKRGLFLQWYAHVEPPFLSGINDIDPQAEKRIIDALNNQISQNRIDSELYSMLSYYAEWDFVFDHFKDYASLRKWLKSRLDYNSIIQRLKQSDLICRGQMGIYWQSVIPFD